MDEINTAVAITRNFLVDADELVDELLSAIKQFDWTHLKMEYQLSKLHATKKEDDQVHELGAEWKEFDEEVQLRISVNGSPETLPQRQQMANEIMTALFPNDIFRRVNEEN